MGTDFDKAKAVLKEDMAVLDSDAAKVKAWYKAFPFYAGCIVGAVVEAIVRHFL